MFAKAAMLDGWTNRLILSYRPWWVKLTPNADDYYTEELGAMWASTVDNPLTRPSHTAKDGKVLSIPVSLEQSA
jgi:hypothetical protein